MEYKYFLFTKLTCPMCIGVKKLAKNKKEIKIVSLDEQPTFIDKYHISSLPSMYDFEKESMIYNALIMRKKIKEAN